MVESKPTVMGLNQFYSDYLASIGLIVSDDGLVNQKLTGASMPATIGGKRLILPLPEVLRNPDWNSTIAFHPLGETIYGGESELMKTLKKLVEFRVSSILATLIIELVDLASDKDGHKKLSPRQGDLLTILYKVDAKTVTDFTKVIDSTSKPGSSKLCSLYLKRGGKFKGESYSRVAVLSFPFTDEFSNEDRTINGVKLRKDDFKMFCDLVNYIIPFPESLEEYSAGSRSLEAPFFDAITLSTIKILTTLNSKVELFKDYLDNYTDLHSDLNWVDTYSNIGLYAGVIPTLKGAEGKPSVDDIEKAKYENDTPVASIYNVAPPPPPSSMQYNQPQMPVHQYQTPPEPIKVGSGGISWTDLQRSKRQSQPPLGYPQQPYPQQSPQYPPQNYGTYQPPVQPPQPQLYPQPPQYQQAPAPWPQQQYANAYNTVPPWIDQGSFPPYRQ